MTVSEYQAEAMRFNDNLSDKRVYSKLSNSRYNAFGDLLEGALGLSGETGEVVDCIKKYIFQGHDSELGNIIEELGDVCWYLALICHSLGYKLEDVLELNIKKLERRYPNGFSETASILREEL